MEKIFEISFRGWTRFLSVYNTVELDIVACAFNPSTWEAVRQSSELEPSLVYRVNSRTARTIQRNPTS